MQQRLQGDAFEGMLGTSPTMQTVFDFDSQSGGDGRARADSGRKRDRKGNGRHGHPQQSARKDGPFMAINCSAITGNASGKRVVRA